MAVESLVFAPFFHQVRLRCASNACVCTWLTRFCLCLCCVRQYTDKGLIFQWFR
jgi:hypothetical protein